MADAGSYELLDYEGDGFDSTATTPMASGQETPGGSSRGKKALRWDIPSADDTRQGQGDSPPTDELLRQVSRSLTRLEANDDPDSLPVPIKRPKKSLLRQGGMFTPQNELEEADNAVSDLDIKRRSATDAHSKARQLNEDVSRPTSPKDAPPQTGHGRRQSPFNLYYADDALDSGMTTPEEAEADADHCPKPKQWRMGGLSAYLATKGRRSRRTSIDSTPGSPRKSARNSVIDLVGSASAAASVGRHDLAALARSQRPGVSRSTSDDTLTGEKSTRPSLIRSANSSLLDLRKLIKPTIQTDPVIKDHVEETVNRQAFLIKLCRALMLYGAPTHRIEDMMKATARVLETEAQFLYIPGCMIVSFDDSRTHTTEVKLVRVQQEVDLGRLRDTHDIYKEVIHDQIGARAATRRLEDIMDRKPQHNVWYRIFMFGIASVCVGPFAFGARLIDLPLAFVLGLIVGFLQLKISARTDLYANVFEILAVFITSFFARWWGSYRGGELFCFPALAQSSIALILPGYTVLCGALELQAKSIIAGSVRLVYAIIYSLFLGFALTMGTALYGVINSNATSQTICKNPLSDHGHWIFFFVPPFAFSLMIINQAKYKQMPVMMFIAFAGYVVNYFTSRRFAGNSQISSAVGSFAIAVLANLYSRVSLDEAVKRLRLRLHRLTGKSTPPKGDSTASPSNLEHNAASLTGSRLTLYKILHLGRSPPGQLKEKAESPRKPRINFSLAASAMLPAIFVQVPSGLSVSGSLVQGIATSDQIIKNSTGTTLTAGQVASGQYGASSNTSSSIAFGVGFSVVQVAIGITVGLYLGALVVYPRGKTGKQSRGNRGALFAF